MLFSSIPFLYYFLPLTLLCYFLAPRRAKNAVLLFFSLCGSYFFFLLCGNITCIISGIPRNFFLVYDFSIIIITHKKFSSAK